MNTRIISYVISNLFKLMMALFLFPLAVSVYYREGLKLSMAYIIPIIILCVLNYFLSGKSPENQSFFSKEGLVIVALSWLLISFFGLSAHRNPPNYMPLDACLLSQLPN